MLLTKKISENICFKTYKSIISRKINMNLNKCRSIQFIEGKTQKAFKYMKIYLISLRVISIGFVTSKSISYVPV